MNVSAMAQCLSKEQLLTAAFKNLNDFNDYMKEENWEIDEAGKSEFRNYFFKDLDYTLTKWTANSEYNLQFYYKKNGPNVIVYQIYSGCFKGLLNEFKKSSTGILHDQNEFSSTKFEVNNGTLEFREYKNELSLRKYSILLYNKIELDEALKNDKLPSVVVNKDNSEKEEVVLFVSQEPEYVGGIQELYKDLSSNLIYPKFEKDNNIQGTVYVSFIVEKDGSISDVKVDRHVNGGPGLSTEALRLVSLLKPFTPAKMKDQAVRYRYRLPVKFVMK